MQMRNAPALRNVEAKARRKVGSGLLRHRIAPCAERHKQLALAVKRQIAVHHRGKPQRLQMRDLLAVFLLYRCRKVLVALLNAVPNVVHVVRPHTLLQAVFPVIAAGSQHLAVRPDEHRLNARRAKLQTEYRFAPADQRGSLVAFHIYPSFHGKPAVCVIFSFRHSYHLYEQLYIIIPKIIAFFKRKHCRNSSVEFVSCVKPFASKQKMPQNELPS